MNPLLSAHSELCNTLALCLLCDRLSYFHPLPQSVIGSVFILRASQVFILSIGMPVSRAVLCYA